MPSELCAPAIDIAAAVARLKTPAAAPLVGPHWHSQRPGAGPQPLVARVHCATIRSSETRRTSQPAFRPWSRQARSSIAASTRRLLGDRFRLRDLGQHDLKGIAEPVSAFVVEGVAAVGSRFAARHPAGQADLIGRESEIEFLLERQAAAWQGEGQIVLISGEAGIGKSRLVAAFQERIDTETHTVLRYQCSPHYSNSALHPVIAQLDRAAGLKTDDTPEQRLDKLEALLASSASRGQDTAPLLAALLSIPFGDRYPRLALNPAQQRRRTLAALLDQFENLARQKPILLIFEDAHWADATTARAARPGGRAHTPFTGPCLVHLRDRNSSLPWVGLAQCQHIDARASRPPTKSRISSLQMTQGCSAADLK